MGGGRGGSEWNLVGPSTSCPEEDCGGYHDVAGLTKRAVGGWPASVPIVFLPFESGFSVHAGGALASEAISEEVSRGAHLHSRTQAPHTLIVMLMRCCFPGSCPQANPCKAGYAHFCGITGGSGALPGWCDEHGRSAWDLQAVLYAVRGEHAAAPPNGPLVPL